MRKHSENRILLTFDLGSGGIADHSREGGTGIVVFRLHNTRVTHVIDCLSDVVQKAANELEVGAVIAVEESRFRVRSFY